MRLTILAAAVLYLAGSANAQMCTSNMIRGTYGVVCSGFATPPQATSQVPFSAIGTVTGDYTGTFTGNVKVVFGGSLLPTAVTGTVVWTDDCAGTISYKQTVNGQSVPNLNVTFHVVDQGKEIRGMVTDAGSNITCTLKLLGR